MVENCPIVPARELAAFPKQYFTKYRSEFPFIRIDDRRFVAIRAEDVFRLLTDRNLPQVDSNWLASIADGMPSFIKFASNSALYANGPEHRVRRGVWGAALSPLNSKKYQSIVDAAVERAIDRYSRNRASGSFVSDFCQAIPEVVMGQLLGLDESAMERIRPLMSRVGGGIPLLFDQRDGKDIDTACWELEQITREFIWRGGKKSQLGLTPVLDARSMQQDLDDSELVANVMLIVIAGINTTRNALATLFALVLTDRVWWNELRVSDEKIHRSVLEALRFEPAVGAVPRMIIEPTKIAGYDFSAGTQLVLSISAALQDPAVFPDPERFDPLRANVQLADVRFGRGLHRCLGQPLAIMMLETALRTVCTRYEETALEEDSVVFDDFGGVRRIDDMRIKLM